MKKYTLLAATLLALAATPAWSQTPVGEHGTAMAPETPGQVAKDQKFEERRAEMVRRLEEHREHLRRQKEETIKHLDEEIQIADHEVGCARNSPNQEVMHACMSRR